MTARIVLLAAFGLVGACALTSPGPDPASATLRLFVDPCGGVARRAAMAVVIDEGLAATVAHPFLDPSGRPSFTRLEALVAGGPPPVEARLVFIDAGRDVALLAVDDDLGHLELGDIADTDRVRVLAFGATPSGTPPRMLRTDITASGPVSFEGQGERAALELGIGVQPGDSGAPVLDDRGRVIGVVFAADRDGKRSWAIAASEYEAAMTRQQSSPVETSCDQPSSLPTIDTKLTHSPGAPPRLWVMPSFLPPSVTVLI